MEKWWKSMVVLINKAIKISLIIISIISLASCSFDDSSKITKEDYNKMIEIIELNDDYDLIDVRSAINSFAHKALNAKTQSDVKTAISYIEPYSTSLLTSSIKTTMEFNSTGEAREVVGIYYCYPEKSSDGKGKFLVIHKIANTDIEYNYGYMLATLNSDGKITQIERW